MLKLYYYKAEEAFVNLYLHINHNGVEQNGTRSILNHGFYLLEPKDRHINIVWRNWKQSYAEREWEWYLSKDRSVAELKKHAKIWDRMHHGDDIVNSNYGWQWSRNEQLAYVIHELRQNPHSRRAALTIYDGKEHSIHSKDSPCTLNIVFNITNSRLNMSVLMRSCDLWYGFCNDQYCFSKLQEMVASQLDMKMGWYYHFVNNLHIYNTHYDRCKIA